MNITRITKLRISAPLFAGLTILSLILSAFPASFFVANAATTGITLDKATATIPVSTKVNFVVDTVKQGQPTAGTYIEVTDGANGGEFFTGTTGGACNVDTPDGDNYFDIGNQKGVCYSNATAGVYTITVTLKTGIGGSVIGEPKSLEITVTEEQVTEEKKVDICHWNGQVFSLLNVSVNSIGNAHGAEGVNDGDIIPIIPDTYTGQNLTTIYNGKTGAEVLANECIVPEPTVKSAELIKIYGDTAGGENQPGWLFNRDKSTETPFEFNTVEKVIGDGALNVFPIANDYDNSFTPPGCTSGIGCDKFIAEYFWLGTTSDLVSFSYDYKIGAGGEEPDKVHFYLNVYANYPGTPVTNFYQCRYNVVPTVGSTGSFTTVTFDPTQSYPVATRNGSPQCPGVPADMGEGATIRAFAINLGDTSTNDTDLDGYFDNVVVDTVTKVTTFDFEPLPPIYGCMDDAALNYNPKATEPGEVQCEYPPVDQCVDGEYVGATTVKAVSQAKKRGGADITDANRIDPTKTLGVNDWVPGTGTNFFSLGFGGTITLEYDRFIVDVAGTDLKIYEGTNGTYPEEKAKVEVSQNGTDFEVVGTASSNNPGRITEIDFASTTFSWIKFVRITDISDLAIHTNDADGFDLDAVVATKVVCDKPRDPEVPKVLPQCSEFFTEGIVVTQEQVLLSHDEGGAFIGPQSVNIPAGYYDINALSFDFHTDNLWDNLPFEQWFVQGILTNAIVFTSQTTDDLPQGQNTIVTQLDRAAYFPDGLDALKWVHAAYPNPEYHSIHPLCIQFIPVEPPVAQCTIESSPNTVIVEVNDFAVPTYTHANWIPSSTIPGAEWIWETYYSADSGDLDFDITRTFVETFNVATPTSATLDIAADNGYLVYINDKLVLDRSLPTYANNFQAHTYKKDVDVTSFIVNGANELKVVATNKGVVGSNSMGNPAGVLFKLTMDVIEGQQCEITTDVEKEYRTVTGYKWNDLNGNGLDDDEPRLSDWVISATNGEDIATTSTNIDGEYTLVLPVGNWIISEEQQDDWYQTGALQNGYPAEGYNCSFLLEKLTPEEQLAEAIFGGPTCDFGNKLRGPETMTITGTKYVVESDSDVPRAGWTIYAFNLDTEELVPTTTDAYGNYTLILPVGDWEVYEAIPEGWEQEAVYENGWLVDGEDEGPYSCYFYEAPQEYETESLVQISESQEYYYEGYNCDFYNVELDGDIPTDTETRSRGGSSSGTKLKKPEPTPLVAGASVSLCPFLLDYMQIGIENDPWEVTKLQLFLNIFVAPTTVTGIFDVATDLNVKLFQEQHRDEILTPWFKLGIVPHDQPTGFVYKLTRWKINDIICPGFEPYPSLDGENLQSNIDLD